MQKEKLFEDKKVIYQSFLRLQKLQIIGQRDSKRDASGKMDPGSEYLLFCVKA